MANSQNGFPALLPGSIMLHRWFVPFKRDTSDRYLYLRNGSAGFLLTWLTLSFHESVEWINNDKVYDDWAYAYRPIRGDSDLSNHASGTAVDLNATRHPLGVRGTFSLVQRAKILWLLKVRLRGCIRWGGSYSGRPDEMHFEIDRSLGDCEKRAKRLMRSKRGKRILGASQNVGQRKVILS